ncbi:glycosyltransferase family 2 protein [Streptomyces sp. NPDC055157]
MTTATLRDVTGTLPLAVLMTCHNRRDRTLLNSLLAQVGLPDAISIRVHLVDAGSSDGTAEAVRAAFPGIGAVTVGPDVRWGTGMTSAARRAPANAHVPWLNDDVTLHPRALAMLTSVRKQPPRRGGAIAVAPSDAGPR